MFLPTTPDEMNALGWDALDVILVTGDTYIDSPFIGVAVIGRLLASKGYRVGIIAQPEMESDADIACLGEPLLFWGVSGGSVDSMVANYTATKKKRRTDDFTPGGENNRRPDRAVMAYTNLIRRYFKNTVPIVLGGVEASLRRVAHYDYWSNNIRRSILFDAKADYLVYGMGEKAILDLAGQLKRGDSVEDVKGICYIAKEPKADYIQLPDYEACVSQKKTFTEMFHVFYQNNDPITAKGLIQQTGDRYLIQNPPQPNPTQKELDSYYELPYERDPYISEEDGEVRAMDTIRFSITSHRGCYGECNFCSIAVHQGRTVISRSPASVLREAKELTQHPLFKGAILDVGGPTANMYGFECEKKVKSGACSNKRCLFPEACPSLKPDHRNYMRLLRRVSGVPGVKKVFVASGIRPDLAMDDEVGLDFISQVARKHTSGQLKLAPEHTSPRILKLMGKPGVQSLEKFRNRFTQTGNNLDREQYLTYYFIAAHPGCSGKDMAELKAYATRELSISPEQVQIFTPLPSTYSALMYYTQSDPFTGEPLFVEKDIKRKEKQKAILVVKRREMSEKGFANVGKPASKKSVKIKKEFKRPVPEWKKR